MRKFYSLVLIAAGLLIGTNAWGFTAPVIVERSNASLASHALPRKLNVTNGHETQTADDQAVLVHKNSSLFFASIDDAINAIESNDTVTLKLLNDVSATAELVVKDGMFVTLDLNNHVLNIANYIDVGWNSSSNCRLDIVGPGNINMATGFFYLKGLDSPDTENFAVLNIGENVIVNNPDYYVLGVFNPSYGIVINVAGYVGGLYGSSINGTAQQTTGNPVQINILPTGTMAATGSSAGIYAAGYGIWNIQGTVVGGIGIYAKAGDFTLDGATIIGTGEYQEPVASGNGYGGGGSALIFDSMTGYAGQMHLTVTGDTKISSTDGYAIEEVVTSGTNHMTGDGMRIESGTFIGKDEEHCLFTTDELKTIITTNGSLTGGIFNGDIIEFVNNPNVVINYVDMGDGKYRWTLGMIPEDKEWINDINTSTTGDFVQMNAAAETITELNGDKEVEYLALLGKNTVIVHDEEVLTAKEIVLNENAKIIVEPGGMVRVTSKQGIISTSDDNLEVHTQEGKPGVLLINPEVTFNTTPKGTVSFISKAYTTADTYVVQRFGIPTGAALESITAKTPDGTADVPTAVGQYIYGSGWTLMGYFGCDKTPMLNVADMNKPFGYYQLQHGASTPGTVVTMTGALVGNDNATITLRRHSWCGFANSFMGNIDMNAILNAMMESDDFGAHKADVAVYSYKRTGDDTFTWYPVDLNDDFDSADDAWKKNVEPMQAFILKNNGMSDITFSLNYKNLIYDPAVSPAQAPARSKNISNRTQVTIDVTNEAGLTDQIKLAESNDFSKGYDKGYDAQKYTNDDLNFYITEDNDKQMSHVASDDINNTFLGLSCLNGGTFTMTFSKLNSENFVLVDLENNNQIPMVEGDSYQFTVSNNESVDYRFQIKKVAGVVTDMKEINANIKADNMIYTLAGQCVGHASNWSNLRSGVYILNGVKIVK